MAKRAVGEKNADRDQRDGTKKSNGTTDQQFSSCHARRLRRSWGTRLNSRSDSGDRRDPGIPGADQNPRADRNSSRGRNYSGLSKLQRPARADAGKLCSVISCPTTEKLARPWHPGLRLACLQGGSVRGGRRDDVCGPPGKTDRVKEDWDHGRRGEMIRKLKSGEYRLYSRKKDPKTGKRRNLGTFRTREQAKKHERAVQYFKRAG